MEEIEGDDDAGGGWRRSKVMMMLVGDADEICDGDGGGRRIEMGEER